RLSRIDLVAVTESTLCDTKLSTSSLDFAREGLSFVEGRGRRRRGKHSIPSLSVLRVLSGGELLQTEVERATSKRTRAVFCHVGVRKPEHDQTAAGTSEGQV